MDYESAAGFLKTLAHPTRLRIVAAVCKGERCVSNLENLLELKQANVSQHLAILSRAGILRSRRDGMRTCYRLADERVIAILEILGVELDSESWECTSQES
ncbi:MAG: winged helix-turn-helix transcriptional regulator [Firmicutes bacterium]|nr:winged helix-turn-helix transcriptional regulator [Bacillota bacterium]